VKRYEEKEEKRKGGARKDYGKRTGKEGEKSKRKAREGLREQDGKKKLGQKHWGL
jgi:hypothetical protein